MQTQNLQAPVHVWNVNGDLTVKAARPDLGVLVVTHYHRILDQLSPDVVHLLVDGRIAASGGPEMARQIEQEGYEQWRS